MAVLVYRRAMPGRKRSTPEDAITARRALLDGLARDADIFEVLSGLEPLHPRNDTFPGEVFLHLVADALDWCGASRAEPLPLEGLREQFLPECAFRGRQNAKLQYAVLPQRASTAELSRTCWTKSPRGRPTTSGSTPCTQRSPTSAPPLAGQASQYAKHAGTWTKAPATRRHSADSACRLHMQLVGADRAHISRFCDRADPQGGGVVNMPRCHLVAVRGLGIVWRDPARHPPSRCRPASELDGQH